MALVPFPGAAKPAPDDDDDRHIHLTDPDVLEDAGWKPVSQGDEWFELTLQREQQGPVSHNRAGGSDGSSSD